MPCIEYSLKTHAGHHVRGMPDVNVLSKSGELLRVPCIGCEFKERATTAPGHYVKVIADRYSDFDPSIKFATWKPLGPNEAVLGWRTNASSKAAGMWVVYLLLDQRNQLMIIPRHRETT